MKMSSPHDKPVGDLQWKIGPYSRIAHRVVNKSIRFNLVAQYVTK